MWDRSFEERKPGPARLRGASDRHFPANEGLDRAIVPQKSWRSLPCETGLLRRYSTLYQQPALRVCTRVYVTPAFSWDVVQSYRPLARPSEPSAALGLGLLFLLQTFCICCCAFKSLVQSFILCILSSLCFAQLFVVFQIAATEGPN